MKLLARIFGGLAVMLSVLSCTKEPERNMNSSGELDISVYATIEDLSSADSETKASASQIVRLSWDEGDIVYAYDKTGLLGELKVTPTNYNRDAMLTGTIKTPSSPKITLAYCNTSEGVTTKDTDSTCVKFSLKDQDSDKDFFVVYATLDYNNQQVITNQTVSFYFATSLMKIAVTGLDDNKEVTEAYIGELNTACCLSINSDGTPSISGTDPGTIRRSGSDNFSIFDGGRAIFRIAIVDDDHTNRTITINQGQKKFKAIFTSSQLKKNMSYTSVYELNEHLRGATGGHEFVVIAGKKWATMNVGATEVVGPNSYGDYYVPGTVDTAYESIDRETGKFVFKDSNPYGDRFYGSWYAKGGFCDKNGPFAVKNGETWEYRKYDRSVDNKKQLDPEDDVAHVLWGGDWRTPTASEFEELITATYWAWDEYDKGFYVYEPVSDQDAGKIDFEKVNSALYNRSNALLFFPSAGYGAENKLSSNFQQHYAYYLTSTVDIYDRFMAMAVDYWNREINPWHCIGGWWYFGYPVRPISDFENSVPVEKEMEVGDYIEDYGGGVVYKCDDYDGGFYLVSLRGITSKNWEESKNWCESYGDGKWRMPARYELGYLYEQLSIVNQTLYRRNKYNISGDYWSSLKEGSGAWRVCMEDGRQTVELTTAKCNACAVRFIPDTE